MDEQNDAPIMTKRERIERDHQLLVDLMKAVKATRAAKSAWHEKQEKEKAARYAVTAAFMDETNPPTLIGEVNLVNYEGGLYVIEVDTEGDGGHTITRISSNLVKGNKSNE